MNGEAAPAEATGWWARAKARWSYSEAEEAAPVEKTPHDLLKELSDLAPAEAALVAPGGSGKPSAASSARHVSGIRASRWAETQ